nr:IQ domain-containing protein F5-like [Columba livia]
MGDRTHGAGCEQNPAPTPRQTLETDTHWVPGHHSSYPRSTMLARGYQDSHGAAVTIQAWWRGQLVRRALEVANGSAHRIQAWWHRAVSRQREEQRRRALAAYVRREKAIVLLQACTRMWQGRGGDRTIQTQWRRRGTQQRGGTDNSVDLNIRICLA